MASEEEDHQKTTLLLPQEIILTEIASRLPVKSLSQFKSVSKPWLNFISHPNFAKLHLERTQKLRILLASRSVYSTDPQPENSSRRLLAKELNYPLKNRHDSSVQIFGSCNGLVCMSPTSLESSFPFFIYNPTTGESKQLPQVQTPRPLFAAPDIYGFGYSPSIDDYKFVKVAHGQMVQVYSVKTDAWKRAEDFPYNAPYYEPGTPLNGSIHWVQSRGTLANHSWAVLAPAFVEVKMIDVPQPEEQSRLNYSCVIAAFDLSEDKFVDLPMPNSDMDFRRYALGVLGEWLCTMHHYDMVHNEFWVMKEYGVKESWTRIMINVGYGTLRPLCFVGDGGNKALMVVNQERLVELNVEDGTCADLEVGNTRDHDYESDVFVESLVSLGNYVTECRARVSKILS